jgi:hypothetical protein
LVAEHDFENLVQLTQKGLIAAFRCASFLSTPNGSAAQQTLVRYLSKVMGMCIYQVVEGDVWLSDCLLQAVP